MKYILYTKQQPSVEGHITQRWPAWPVCLAAAPAHFQEHSVPSWFPWQPSEKDGVLYSGMLLHGKPCLLAARATIFSAAPPACVNALTHSLSSHLWRRTTIITVSMAMSLWFFFLLCFWKWTFVVMTIIFNRASAFMCPQM